MAKDPFAEMSPGGVTTSNWRDKFDTGRVVAGLVVIASLTFAFAYYVPLSTAHSVLAKEHETLSASHSSASSQLEKTTEQLTETQKERDELDSKLKAIADGKQRLADKATELADKIKAALSKQTAVSVEQQDGSVMVSIDNIQVFRGNEATAHKPGRKLLCAVGKALKDVDAPVEVGGHMTSMKVTNPLLRREYQTAWDASGARAVGALRVLESCGISGKRLSAAGYADQKSVEPQSKKSDGVIRIEITPTGD